MGSEIELKLAIDPIDISRLRHSLSSMVTKRRHNRPRRFVSTYFDTKSLSLAQNGVSLRVRKIGRRRIQTIKLAAADGGDLMTRSEWETPTQRDRPDLKLVDDPALRRLIGKCRRKERLDAMFVTDVRRETWLLLLDGSEVKCALDRGQIAAPKRKMPICEVELELKAGPRAPLFKLARKLNKSAPLHVETRSKAARGCDLVTGTAPLPPSANFPVLDPAMDTRSAFGSIARACTANILACASYARQNTDPEGIHQLRIAIRRLRAASSIFRQGTKERRSGIASNSRTLRLDLGAARDWDVLIEIEGTMPKRLRGQKGFSEMMKTAGEERTKESKRARAALEDPRCTDLLLELTSWIDRRFGLMIDQSQPPEDVACRKVGDFAAQLLKERQRKVRKLAKKVDKLDPQELHELRIRIKKLRYVVELFQDLWRGAGVEKYLSKLKQLQDSLGIAHDVLVSSHLIRNLEAHKKRSDKNIGTLVSEWAATSFDREKKKTIHLLRKMPRFEPLAPKR